VIPRYLHEDVEPQGQFPWGSTFYDLKKLENLGLPEY